MRRNRNRNYRQTNYYEKKSPTKISNNHKVENICKTFARFHVLSALNTLEDYRLELNRKNYQTLVEDLLRAFNNPKWSVFLSEQRVPPFARNWRFNNPPYLIIFYYILSIIKKYNIPNTKNIWKEILTHQSTHDFQFFKYLHKNQITIPDDTRQLFIEIVEQYGFRPNESKQSAYLRMHYSFPRSINSRRSVRYIEKVFFQLKTQQNQSSIKDYPLETFIRDMNEPGKLSLFLSYFRDYDLNQMNSLMTLNVLDQVMLMRSDFSDSPRNTRFHRRTNRKIRPNGLIKYQTLRLINLTQQLINSGARLSKPAFISNDYNGYRGFAFYLTSIGIYVMLSIGIDNINPEKSSFNDNNEFLIFILDYIQRFSEDFQNLILQYLIVTCPFIHSLEFRNFRRENEQDDDQKINDLFFQTSLTLKQWCRLKIRQNFSQKDISKFNVPKKIIDYCSYGLSNPNFAFQCVAEVIKYNGHK